MSAHISRLRITLGSAFILVALATFIPVATAQAAAPQFGTKDGSTSGASTAPSGSKPESKLWYNDGIWWGSMWSTSPAGFHIFRLNTAGTVWTDTGTVIDTRASSRGDALWDGSHLYIASHEFAADSSHNTSGKPSRLYRFTYDSGTKTYTKESGYPVTIVNFSVETLVIDKDSTGTLWATWTQSSKLRVAHTVGGNDKTWSASIQPSITGAGNLTNDDISSVIAFGGNKIGVMWSNQTDSKMYFTTHTDGAADTAWSSSEAATTGTGSADDHINLKKDSAGRVYSAVKTSLTGGSSTLNQLLVRPSGGGSWANYRFGTVSNSHTRPIVIIDEVHGLIHMFATGPYAGASSGQNGGTIYEKTSPLSPISLTPSGVGTPFIQDPNSNNLNNPSSTKQNPTSTSGIVVLATNDSTHFYWHNTEGIVTNTTPTANPTTAVTPFNTAATVNLSGTDPETCEMTFAIVTPPTHGTLAGSFTNNACTPGSPNSDSAGILYTPTSGYFGPDSFTFTVNDGTATSAPATASLTVSPNTAPTANNTTASVPYNTAATVSLSGSDLESCTLTFSIVTPPTNGTLGSISDNACVAGSPNTDSATIVYTPNSSYIGSDSFTYKVNDGLADSASAATATLTVNANTAPTADVKSKSTAQDAPVTVDLTGSDLESCTLTFSIVTPPSNGTLGSIADNACVPGNPNHDSATIVYTPNSGYNGSDSFVYKVNDGSLDSADTTVSLTISANTPPTAITTSKTTAFNTPATVNLSGTDPETCQLTFSIVTPPSHGILDPIVDNACVAGSPNNDSATVVYTPSSNYSGSDSFTYKVNDGTSDSSAATASLTVSPNTLPTANPTSKSTAFNTAATVNLSGMDPETCQLTFSILALPSHGSLGSISDSPCVAGSPNSDSATVLYTPTSGYSGPDSFTYKVNDGAADSAPATANLTVSSNDTTVTLNPLADTYVSSSGPTTNYGTLTTAKVREGAGDAANPNYRTYMRFDLTGYTSLTAVSLRLYVTDATVNIESVYLVPTDTWVETTVNYTTAPVWSDFLGSVTGAPAGAYVTITLDQTKIPPGGHFNLVIKSSSTDSLIVSTREDATNKPQLVVTGH